MGTIAACECCLLRDKWDGDTTSPEHSDSSDSGQSCESSSSDEERPLRKKKRKKSKHRRKKHNRRSQREVDPDSEARDESYFSSSNDEEDEGYHKRNRNRKKHKKRKKKKKHSNHESPLVEDIQRALMEKSQNEIAKSANEDVNAAMIGGLYGMDVKTMELLMSVGDLGAQAAPKPPMPSIISQPFEAMEYTETQQEEQEEMPPLAADMSNQLKSYTSEIMYGNVTKPDSDEEYNDLIVDHDDTTPALPQAQANWASLNDEQTRNLGGVDYDYDLGHIPEQESKTNSGSMALETRPTLREDEKNVSFTRTKKMLEAQNSRGPDEIQAMISAQYTHKPEEEELETDDSSYSEEEREEIQRRKTEGLTGQNGADLLKSVTSEKVLSAKLFRPGTVTDWQADDLTAMESAMSKQIEAMKKHNSKNGIEESEDEFESDIEEEMDDVYLDQQIAIKAAPTKTKGTKTSQLFRVKSTYKWDADRLDIESEEMQAQLASLVLQHQSSTGD